MAERAPQPALTPPCCRTCRRITLKFLEPSKLGRKVEAGDVRPNLLLAPVLVCTPCALSAGRALLAARRSTLPAPVQAPQACSGQAAWKHANVLAQAGPPAPALQVSGAVFDVAGGKETKAASIAIEGHIHQHLVARMPSGKEVVLFQADATPREPRRAPSAAMLEHGHLLRPDEQLRLRRLHLRMRCVRMRGLLLLQYQLCMCSGTQHMAAPGPLTVLLGRFRAS